MPKKFDRIEFLRKKIQMAVASAQNRKALAGLRDKILSSGGDEVLLRSSEPDLDHLLARGRIIEGQVTNLQGATSQCHRNVARLVAKGEVYSPATGYALSEDEDGLRLWRQHSWGMLEDGTLVETTSPRTSYWGIVLTGRAATNFVGSNL